MIKKIVFSAAALFVLTVLLVYLYRYSIIRYSAESIIRKNLPGYVKIDSIIFDFKAARIAFRGFKIVNPPQFSGKYALEIEEIACGYRMKGKNILDGLEITEPVISGAELIIERLNDSRVSLIEMQKEQAKTAKAETDKKRSPPERPDRGGGLASLLKLPETYKIKNSKIIFADKFKLRETHIITLANINAGLKLKFDERYLKILSAACSGQGNFGGRADEIIKWDSALDPTRPRLTMSNRFEAYNIDLVSLRPYYDRYSPFVFQSGRFSGSMIFDFDNGRIGSSNEIHLSDLTFYVKRGYENAIFWETTVQDMAKYFTSPYGDIVFDFKIKGDMDDPKFYLGPISKQAIARLAVDKISTAIQKVSGEGQPGAAKTDFDKAKGYIELFKGLIKK